MLDDILVMVLAGGVGERLYPLTKERAKPAVYFGGPYRIIDFTLSNCINSGLRRIFIALQYKSLSLSRHIRMGWSVVADELGEFIEILQPQKRVGEHWYQGTADAVYQNLYSILRENPQHLIVLSGDHVYKMDYAKMLRFHQERGAGATLAVIEIPSEEASRFGVLQVDEQRSPHRLPREAEGPAAGRPGARVDGHLHLRHGRAGAGARGGRARKPTTHDFGKDIIPALISKVPVYAYRFYDENKKAAKYWRDIGTLDAYLRSEHGPVPGQPGVQPVRSRVAAAHLPAAGAAGEVRLRRRGPPLRPGARLDHLGRLHRLGQPRSRQRALPERARAQLLRRRSEHPDAGRARRPPRAHPPRDHRSRRASSRAAR